jgi:type IV pilus assembly protein PilE
MKRRTKGITLIELMVVVVIVAILAAVAYPSYRRYAVRANRTEAKVGLLQLTQALEKCYTRIHDYDECLDEIDIDANDSERFSFSVSGTPTATEYTLQAVPIGGQAEDDECGTLRINQTGERTRTGAAPMRDCW